ncbi:unnamed protein product [Sphenostylis stenocarpa]|uniref:Albumin I chain a domain-containing protein n=1 Tax=Sphenostylis stenocarpa TaxID=92480 RepID=A0AA86W3R2_9FABA|nr:unnamed protein product [Sphenostylis stenocarpa]CAJ1977996.1 unnamed protein product [Sphenostylis stenocarpa]
MAFLKLAPLALFLLATSSMLSMKNIEAVGCSGGCSPFQMPPCGSTDCRCIPVGLFVGYCTHPSGVASFVKKLDEHPNLCMSDNDCVKKGSGNFCARYPNQYVDYGWCFDSNSEALKGFLALPRTITM